MAHRLRSLADWCATGAALILSPVLKFVAVHRQSLPRYQRLCDKLGFQIRSAHYYEPTYSEADLPAITTGERALPGIDLREAAQLELLSRFTFADELDAIPFEKTSDTEFAYDNVMYSLGDAETLYSMIRVEKPRRIIEIGSGNSTLMARKAIAANMRDDASYACDHACIEPFEMPWLERVGPRIIRQKVENVPLETFDALEAGDILFIDSSHVIRPYGDVLREFHEIVPRLKPGVNVHVDDIFTPRDYPERWLRQDRRLWNEQYLLESFLAFNSDFEVTLAVNWLKNNHYDALLKAAPKLRLNPAKQPGAFWFRRKMR